MNFQKVFWGIIILLFGIFLLLDHFGIANIHWWNLFNFWPVILIIWGVSVLPIKKNVRLLISASIIILTIITVIYISGRSPDYFRHHHEIYFDKHHFDDDWDEPYYDADTNTTNI